MSLDVAGPPADRAFATTTWGRALVKATHFALALLGLAIVIQAFIVVQARPQDLVTGVFGMARRISRSCRRRSGRHCKRSTSRYSGHWPESSSRFRLRSLQPPT